MQVITKKTEAQVERNRRRRRNIKQIRKVNKARSLSVQALNMGIYKVRGNKEHLVVLGPVGARCDCGNGFSPCSHVIAVRMHRGEWDKDK